ncbi:Hematopoietic prostaglandin D synthase [Aphelenchoides besseyi]|nr:Hematopoietic prostaglandin D synthase [Aphelenchoides besseyi]KAI6220462.1 Hematopoietic prostaglandin D synthase [Aphelenchoides besseyi]
MFWLQLVTLFFAVHTVHSECRDKLYTCNRAFVYCQSPPLADTLKANCERTCGYCTLSPNTHHKARKHPRHKPHKKPRKKPQKKKPPTKPKLPKYVLHHFQSGSCGEAARMIFAYRRIPYTDFQIEPKNQWPKIKSTYPNGQLPMLQIGNQNLTQTMTIYRYLAQKFDLRGKSEIEAATLNQQAEFFHELVEKTTTWIQVTIGAISGDKDKLHTDDFLPAIQSYGPKLEKILIDVASGFFVKSGVSWVDFYVAGVVKTFFNFDPTTMASYPTLKAHNDRIYGLPELQPYVKKNPPGP